MKLLNPKTRVAFGLVCVTVCVTLTAMTMGIIPDRNMIVVKDRVALCKTIGMYASNLVSQGNQNAVSEYLQSLTSSRDDILSAGIRKKDGRLWVDVGNHGKEWTLSASDDSTDDQIKIPFAGSRHNWNQLEIHFQPLKKSGIISVFYSPTLRLVSFVSVSCFVLYMIFLHRMLRGMDPSQAVPNRVRSALDVLAEGLLVLDQSERIMLANHAFEDLLGISAQELQGRKVSTLPWEEQATAEKPYPWTKAIKNGSSETGNIIRLMNRDNDYRTFVVNAAPIRNATNVILGVMVCLEDVTPLEREREELNKTLAQLEHSREEIRRQNEELRILATLDPLTSCMNRRAFFEQFDTQWKTGQRYDFAVSCIMIDIDHFKAVNDTWGHSIGDEVLRRVSGTLRKMVRDCDAVCRYGGEEFCILLPHIDVENGFLAAERFRTAVEALEFDGLKVTASFGISDSKLGAEDPQGLLLQADKSLYLAKNNGRNQCVRWDQAANYPEVEEKVITHTPLPESSGMAIPFHAVSALLSTLTYRDPNTAEHSIRVADMCVLMAAGKMPATELYLLEIAALLHDIGKIGVPDAILLKPGPLDDDEWKVINAHERIGMEIIRFAFANPELVETVMYHHAWYNGNPDRPDLKKGKDCSLRARILTIADAYDTMISDRVYRKAHTQEEAFEELRRCAGTQFDPELVEDFIDKASHLCDQKPKPQLTISYETAVNIGETIESLAYAIDKQNCPSLALLAGRLKLTAAQKDLPSISSVAERLETAAAHDAELDELVGITQELLDLCRSVQRAYIQPLISTSRSENLVIDPRK